MFKERDMREAIEWLFSLYDDEDYEWQGEDEDAPDFVSILCLPQVCNALRDIAQTVYQYEVNSSYEKGFKYRGQELFGQRACLVCSEIDQAVMDSVSTYYENELWLLEDMSFALVHAVGMGAGGGSCEYETVYRAFVKTVDCREDLFINPEELYAELDGMCEGIWESEATIYEI